MIKRRIKALFFLVVSIICLICCVVSSSAMTPSQTPRSYFPPFHMSMISTVGSQYTADWSNTVMCDIPSIFYNNPSVLEQSAYNEFSDGSYGYFVSYYYTPTSQGVLSSQSYTSLDFLTEVQGYDPEDSTELLYTDMTVRFQDGYLSSEYGMYSSNDGLVFASYQNSSRVRNPYDDGGLTYTQVVGEFVVSGLAFEPISVSYISPGILSYYEILLHADVDYSTIIDFDSDEERDAWLEELDNLYRFDYYNLSDANIAYLKQFWSAVGPIYGRFDLTIDDFEPTIGYYGYYDYKLTNYTQLENFVLQGYEDAAFRGLTGFERVTKFLGSAVGGFMDLELMPGFHLGAILVVLIAFSIVLWWLKVFAGG